ncbi:MAG: PH domain-containing protein [Pseudomonadota bacterium]
MSTDEPQQGPPHTTPVQTFRSAVDWWFYAVLLFVCGTLITTALAVLQTPSTLGLASVGVSAIIALGLPFWLLVSTRYQVTGSRLLVRSGPFSWHIERAEISSVTDSNSPISSPALSLKRLEIRYGDGRFVLVSPADRNGFLDALNA